MNKFILMAPIALLLAGSLSTAFAQEAESDAWRDAVQLRYHAMSPSERAAEHQAQVEAAKAPAAEAPAPKPTTRAEVRAALMLARLNGELAAINAEAYAPPAYFGPTVKLAGSGR